jgi:hypothetical protein
LYFCSLLLPLSTRMFLPFARPPIKFRATGITSRKDMTAGTWSGAFGFAVMGLFDVPGLLQSPRHPNEFQAPERAPKHPNGPQAPKQAPGTERAQTRSLLGHFSQAISSRPFPPRDNPPTALFPPRTFLLGSCLFQLQMCRIALRLSMPRSTEGCLKLPTSA